MEVRRAFPDFQEAAIHPNVSSHDVVSIELSFGARLKHVDLADSICLILVRVCPLLSLDRGLLERARSLELDIVEATGS